MSTTRTIATPKALLVAGVISSALLLTLTGCTGTQTGGAPAPAATSSNDGMDMDGMDDMDLGGDDDMDMGGDENTVITTGLKFEPKDITVKVGTTVTWKNGETIGHTITSGKWGDVNEDTGLRGSQTPDGEFDHALAAKGKEGDSFTYTFDEVGVFQYYCQPHLTMNATVTVVE